MMMAKASLPPAAADSVSTQEEMSDAFCAPFPSDAAVDAYLASIAPPRELVCPITQELLRDPVVAEDGHTYERHSLATWFGMGRTRSPVTNALLENVNADGLAANLAVASMAVAHRERLGRELIRICNGIKEREGRCDENGAGVRVEGLLDAGADPNGRGEGGNAPLHLLIQSGNIHLATHLLNHDASVTLTNDAGMDCIATAEHTFAHQQERLRQTVPSERNKHNAGTIAEWNDFIRELKRREAAEKARSEARDRARSQANEEHRERQRTLAANARSASRDGGQSGLGRVEDGVGYFPSLAALQFQGSIPAPSPSVAEYENREKERLNRIMKCVAFVGLVYFLLS
ncbi:hypothetical protein ACHAXT_009228 [Thalassiosira profunda]